MEEAHYIEMKKQVGEALRSQADQFDKAILALAAGALALSLTFIKEIAPSPDGLTIRVLAWSSLPVAAPKPPPVPPPLPSAKK